MAYVLTLRGRVIAVHLTRNGVYEAVEREVKDGVPREFLDVVFVPISA